MSTPSQQHQQQLLLHPHHQQSQQGFGQESISRESLESIDLSPTEKSIYHVDGKGAQLIKSKHSPSLASNKVAPEVEMDAVGFPGGELLGVPAQSRPA